MKKEQQLRKKMRINRINLCNIFKKKKKKRNIKY